MDFNDFVEKVRMIYENADARSVFEHVALQINLEGDTDGIFYVEVANRRVSVEPYEYYDKDGIVTTDINTLLDIMEHKYNFQEAIKRKSMKIDGNLNKFKLFEQITF